MEVKTTVSESSKIEVLKPYPSYRIQLNPLKIMKLESDFEIKPKVKNGLLYFRLDKDDRAAHHIVAAHCLGFENGDKVKFKNKDKVMDRVNYYHPDNLIVEKYKGSKSKSCDSDDEPVCKKDRPTRKDTIKGREDRFDIKWDDVSDTNIDIHEHTSLTNLFAMAPFQLNTKKDYIYAIELLRLVFAVVHQTPELFIIKDFVIDCETDEKRVKLSYAYSSDISPRLNKFILRTDYDVKKEKYISITAWDLYIQYSELFTFDCLTFYSKNNPRAFNYFGGYFYRILKVVDNSVIDEFLKFVKEVIANNNEEMYTYIIHWIASLIQIENCRLETVLVLIGNKGTGKNVFCNVLLKLLTYYSVQTSDFDHVIGHFNSVIENMKLVILNELQSATSTNRFLNFDKFKSQTTERTIVINQKHAPHRVASNVMNYIATSNHANPVIIENKDRRYVVTNVSEKYMQDTDYFEKLTSGFTKKFYRNLLTYFMTLDISKFNHRKIPMTEAKQTMIDSSKSPVESYVEEFYDTLERQTMVNLYKHFCEFHNSFANGKSFNGNQNTFRGIISQYVYKDGGHIYDKNRNRKDTFSIKPELLTKYQKEFPKEDTEPRITEEEIKIVCGIVDKKTDDAVFKE